MARAIQHFEIIQWVVPGNNQVRQFTWTDGADFTVQAQHLCTVDSGCTDHFQRVKAGFLQQLHLPDIAEPIKLPDVTRVGTQRDPAAVILVIVEELHPQAEVFFPGDFIGSGPVEPVRAVSIAGWLEKGP